MTTQQQNNNNLSVEDNLSSAKVFINSDTDEEFINSSRITEDQMKTNDDKVVHIEFKSVSKN